MCDVRRAAAARIVEVGMGDKDGYSLEEAQTGLPVIASVWRAHDVLATRSSQRVLVMQACVDTLLERGWTPEMKA